MYVCGCHFARIEGKAKEQIAPPPAPKHTHKHKHTHTHTHTYQTYRISSLRPQASNKEGIHHVCLPVSKASHTINNTNHRPKFWTPAEAALPPARPRRTWRSSSQAPPVCVCVCVCVYVCVYVDWGRSVCVCEATLFLYLPINLITSHLFLLFFSFPRSTTHRHTHTRTYKTYRQQASPRLLPSPTP